MEFNWVKKGLIFDPTDRFPWMHSFAQVPTAVVLEDRIRIYFTCRPPKDENGNSVSLISFIDVNKNNPADIIYIHNESIIELGPRGSFDEFGVHPGNILLTKDEFLFYYQGWMREVSVPYYTCLGLASSLDNGMSFTKKFSGPIFSRDKNTPYLTNGFYPFYDGKSYKMYYAGCSEWIKTENGDIEPVYHIKFAYSKNGTDWITNDHEIIEKKYNKESAGRPCVIQLNHQWHMWFCYRDVNSFRGHVDGAYKIGYAHSEDGLSWRRDDEKSGIQLSETGWDSQMMAYPYVIKVNDKLYLFYNGNEFGKYGFGFAELKL